MNTDAEVLERLNFSHFVYLARCRDGSLYCGYARNPAQRIAVHNSGKGSKILRGKRPVKLVFTRGFKTKNAALRFELALKRQSHRDKHLLARSWIHMKTGRAKRRLG